MMSVTVRFALFLLVSFCFLGFTIPERSPEEVPKEILGYWLPEDKASKVHIYQNAKGDYIGKIVGLQEPHNSDGSAKCDIQNPDVKLRTRTIVGVVVAWGFKYKGDKTWDNGHIYDCASGKVYDCYAKIINPNCLEIRAYVGVTFLGKTVRFSRTALNTPIPKS